MAKPVIVDVPQKMQKLYGAGTMLHPDIEMVENAIQKIPYGKVIAIESLCRSLSNEFNTNTTCPMRTTEAIKKIIKENAGSASEIPFWRVIRNNKMLINSKHIHSCVSQLKKEGFKLTHTKKGEVMVVLTPDQLYTV